MRIILFVGLCILSFNSHGQDITGDWTGQMESNGSKLTLVFHISKEGDKYTTLFDSPQQNAFGLLVEETSIVNDSLKIIATKYGIKFSGRYNATENTFTGVFQGKTNVPLTISKNHGGSIKSLPSTRPQDPIAYPYYQEEVVIENVKANLKLAGTLTLPKDKRCSKILILISGSGPQNRNEEITSINHRPFLVWSDWLTRNGYGVLRYDDRGVGKSTGNFDGATTLDFADDVESVVNYISARADLKQLSIGLLGHSEGGMIAPIVAQRNRNVKFVILLAAPGVPCDQLMLQQLDDLYTSSKISKDVATINHRTSADGFAYITANAHLPDSEFKDGLKTIFLRDLQQYPTNMTKGLNIDELANKQVAGFSESWFRSFISFHPETYLSKLRCPVLAMNGTLDSQVKCDDNLTAIEQNLRKAGNHHYSIVKLEGLNHLFQKATTGVESEYGSIEETVDPIALNKVIIWLAGI